MTGHLAARVAKFGHRPRHAEEPVALSQTHVSDWEAEVTND